jgi:quaternary ammonium compound-resistance protein SugE
VAWVVLFVSAALETVWATALGESNGFTILGPSLVFAATIAVSLGAFGYVLRHIPISTAYAVWTGTGAALTVLWSMSTGAEPVTVLRVLLIAGIVGAVVGLKVVPARPAAPPLLGGSDPAHSPSPTDDVNGNARQDK